MPSAPYQQPVDAVLASLGTNARSGLTHTEACVRLERYGPNELTAEKPVPAWRKFLAQFTDVLVILLLVATVFVAEVAGSAKFAAAFMSQRKEVWRWACCAKRWSSSTSR
jgi:magnesium-transporting ATPase (P-type)